MRPSSHLSLPQTQKWRWCGGGGKGRSIPHLWMCSAEEGVSHLLRASKMGKRILTKWATILCSTSSLHWARLDNSLSKAVCVQSVTSPSTPTQLWPLFHLAVCFTFQFLFCLLPTIHCVDFHVMGYAPQLDTYKKKKKPTKISKQKSMKELISA